MGNITTQTFYGNSTITIPAGVTSVNAVVSYPFTTVVDNGGSIFAIDSLGKLWSWGNNNSGQLGVGDINPRSSPTAVLGNQVFTSLSNQYGEPNPATGSMFAIGGYPTNGLNTNLYAWGDNGSGQLGLGDRVSRSSPVAVLGGLVCSKVSFATYNAGDNTSFAAVLLTNGSIYDMGENYRGQLGVGDAIERSSPVQVLGGLSFCQISVNVSYVLALATNGSLYSWGYDSSGALGVGDINARSSPVQVLGGLSFGQIIQCPDQDSAVFAITPSGTAYAWGSNATGQLGLGDANINRSSPVQVLGGLSFAKIIGPNPNYGSVFGLTTSGKLYGWGANGSGQLGLGDRISRSSPTQVLGNLKFVNVFNGQSGATFAITDDGTLYAWGQNAYGQLGVGDTVDRSSPVLVVGGIKFSNVLTAFDNNSYSQHAIGISTSGQIYAWGGNDNGELGTGDTTNRNSPTKIAGNFLANPGTPPTVTQGISVTPGSTYSLNMLQFNPTFGQIVIGAGVPSSVTISYEE